MDIAIITQGSKLPRVWDFVHSGETPEQVLERCIKSCKREAQDIKRIAAARPQEADYWNGRAAYYQREAETAQIMEFEQFKQLEREAILHDAPEEITEEKYHEMLDVLPPLHYVDHAGFTMFCMCEFYTGTYTMQYAYHSRTGKYYSCMVDATDRSTWICERIKED